MTSAELLAGPILRRAEPSQVCIWIATSAPVEARVEIYQLAESGRSGEPPEILGNSGDDLDNARTVRLGDRLYVTLIRVHPKQSAFPQDRLLAYDLVLGGKRLADLGLLSGPRSLAYEGLPLPTFFLPSEALSLLHGSCRNLGGSGLDAMPCGDELIAQHARDLSLRPGILILDGDQVYADHLPSPLIGHLTSLGNELMGWEESLPGVDGRLADIHVDGRASLATTEAKFTSGGAGNQLMAFGEYSALYLVAWNEANWPERFPTFREVKPVDEAGPVEQVKGAAHAVLGLVEKTPQQAYEEMVENLEGVRQRIPAVRRLLANIPTYMIFDDHDVTDDLFLTKKWKQDVRASAMGRRIVANALAAAWAFQCWGSDPDRYPDTFLDAIASHLQMQARSESAARSFEEAVWGFQDWCFHIPIRPVTIVMDTRTQRGYDSDEGAARLIGEGGLQTLARAAERAGYRRGDPLILVSPTPVVGYETVEGMQERVSRYLGPYHFDLESWHANLDGYASLFRFLISNLSPSYVVLLSGDVHYAFTISATFTWEGMTLPIVQLTSSALKNTGVALKIVELVSLFAGRTDRHFGWDQIAKDVEEAQGGTVLTGGDWATEEARPSGEWGRSVYVFKGEPAPLPANLPAGADPQEEQPAQGKAAPNWRSTRTFEPTWGYRSEPIVGENNLGLVRFRHGNLVIHRLLIPTRDGTRASTALVSTLHGPVILRPLEERQAGDRPVRKPPEDLGPNGGSSA